MHPPPPPAAGSYYIGRLEDEEVEKLLIYSLKEVYVENGKAG
jgi:hypothetical protein